MKLIRIYQENSYIVHAGSVILQGHLGQKNSAVFFFSKSFTDLKTNFTKFEHSATFRFEDITA